MASGGARATSGPPKQEGSRTSDRAGVVFTALDPAGFAGEAPDLTAFLLEASDRHLSIWGQLWSTPQAIAWSVESWRWPVVADLVKWMVRSDDPDAPAAVATTVRQLREDLGLSAAGLARNGWKIAEPKMVDKSAEEPEASNVTSIKDRLNRGSA